MAFNAAATVAKSATTNNTTASSITTAALAATAAVAQAVLPRPAGTAVAMTTTAATKATQVSSGGATPTPAPTPPTPAPALTSNLSQGSNGNSVVQLQKQLNQQGANLVVDGIFGAKTQAAVRDFQTRHGLVVDGIVGPQTWVTLWATSGTVDTKPTNMVNGYASSNSTTISAIIPANDAIIGGIQLVGSFDERHEILKYLNTLTDHTLGMKYISKDRAFVYIREYADGDLKYLSGNELLARLMGSEDYTTYFKHSNEKNRQVSGINSSTIFFNPREEGKVMVIDRSTGNVKKDINNMPIEIIVAHELIHADREMRGTQIKYSEVVDHKYQSWRLGWIIPIYSKQTDVPKEELATIGLDFNVAGDITENMIRAEQGLLLRGAYFTR